MKKGLSSFRNAEYEALSSLHTIQNHVISLEVAQLWKRNRVLIMRMGLVVC